MKLLKKIKEFLLNYMRRMRVSLTFDKTDMDIVINGKKVLTEKAIMPTSIPPYLLYYQDI